jgi:hypothetical protein
VGEHRCVKCRTVLEVGTSLFCAACAALLPINHSTPVHEALLTHYTAAVVPFEPSDSGPHLPETDYLTNVPGVAESGTAVAGVRAGWMTGRLNLHGRGDLPALITGHSWIPVP